VTDVKQAPQRPSTSRTVAGGLLLAVAIVFGVVAAVLSQASSPSYEALFLTVVQLWVVHVLAAVVLFGTVSRQGRRVVLVGAVVLALPVIEMGVRVL